jgi:hypothetical protein
VNYDEILLSALCATVPCVLFDHLLYGIQQWQRRRIGFLSPGGFGPVGRTVVYVLTNFLAAALISFIYLVVGHRESDAFLIGAFLWLTVTVPILFTSRYIEETQRQFLAGRILGWLVKTAIASATAASLITLIG